MAWNEVEAAIGRALLRHAETQSKETHERTIYNALSHGGFLKDEFASRPTWEKVNAIVQRDMPGWQLFLGTKIPQNLDRAFRVTVVTVGGLNLMRDVLVINGYVVDREG
ncbi:MAG: hypothetical protein KGI50_03430 [Patescibacteria group bacterium]|nr:hypothetical protein [Patescibacteria group bacterium]MDE2438343.1 hypothetical protein [Patescibacteria group bacterium]